MEASLCTLAKKKNPSSIVVSLSSQLPAYTEATTISHNDAFKKVKATVARANAAPTTTVLLLINVRM